MKLLYKVGVKHQEVQIKTPLSHTAVYLLYCILHELGTVEGTRGPSLPQNCVGAFTGHGRTLQLCPECQSVRQTCWCVPVSTPWTINYRATSMNLKETDHRSRCDRNKMACRTDEEKKHYALHVSPAPALLTVRCSQERDTLRHRHSSPLYLGCISDILATAIIHDWQSIHEFVTSLGTICHARP